MGHGPGRRPPTDRKAHRSNGPPQLANQVQDGRHPPRAVPGRPAGPQRPRWILVAPAPQWSWLGRTKCLRQQHRWPGSSGPRPARRRLGREVTSSVCLVTWRSWALGRASCPRATGRRPVGRLPRLGRVEIQLGPAWVRYRETPTPETDPPSTFHRPVLVPGRHRGRSSRLRVTLPRCRPSPRCPPAAMPTAPIYPARVRLLLRGLRFSVAGAVQVQPGACSGIRPCVLLGPAVPHRVAD
jgi:hypothetical protein